MSVLVLRFCALKLIFKLISIADCTPSFELVRRRKYSERAIFTATVAIKIASQLFLRLAVNIALDYIKTVQYNVTRKTKATTQIAAIVT